MFSKKDAMQKIIARHFTCVKSKLTYTQYVYQQLLDKRYQVTGICGGSGAGKSTLAHELVGLLGADNSVRVMVDGYLQYPREKMRELGLTGYDLESRDMARFLRDLESLRSGQPIQKPIFNEPTQRPPHFVEEIQPRGFIILEDTIDFSGIADFAIFTFAPDEVMVSRRMARDMAENAFWDRKELEKYIRGQSLPKYKEKHVPAAAKCHLIINTHTNEIFQNKKLKPKRRQS